jgi:hypothetical protein
MTGPDFENERQIEAALAEAVKANTPPAGLQEEIRERLFAQPQAAARPNLQPIAVLAKRRSIVGQITRNHPFQVLAGAIVGMAAAVGFLLLWDGSAVESVSAMEKMAENIRKVRSASWSRIVQLSTPRAKSLKPGQPPAKRQMSFTGYWLASGSRRSEDNHFPKWKGLGPQFTTISPAGKPGISIDHSRKTFFRSPPFLRPCPTTDWQWEALGKFSGKADRDLGVKTIKGKKAHGFQIDRRKIDGPEVMPGTMEVWIDTESNLPVLVRDDEELPDDAVCTVVTTDIQYNVDFGPKLFDTTPPKGYTDETKKPLPLDEQVREIRKSLEACSEATGGTYPGNIDEMSVADAFGKWSRRMTKAIPKLQLYNGLLEVAKIWEYNLDPIYNGKTVSAKDKDKVLLRWKLDDGRYEVIFGDLRAETVTAERLRGLEGK